MNLQPLMLVKNGINKQVEYFEKSIKRMRSFDADNTTPLTTRSVDSGDPVNHVLDKRFSCSMPGIGSSEYRHSKRDVFYESRPRNIV